jgi:hypothetical protein
LSASGYGAVNKVNKTGDTMTGPLDGTSIVTAVVTLVYAATLAIDVSLGGHFRVELTGNTAVAAPASPSDGQKITFELVQDSAGGRTVTWAAVFDFGSTSGVSNTPPVLTTSPNRRDLIGFVYSADLGKWMYAGMTSGF